MNKFGLDILLIVLLLSSLLSILSVAALKSSLSGSKEGYEELFSVGTIYPYDRVSSMRLKYLLPWVTAPKAIQHNMKARFFLMSARASAALAALGLLGMIGKGIIYA